MAQIIVRNLDGFTVERLKARARSNNRSLEAEVRLILEQSAELDIVAARQMAIDIRKRLKGRDFPDLVELIHEDGKR